ncbi:hypothetical protein ACFFGH_10665 [Lysobacter korlensis]|uniref:Uncharacterized protein n=1 Tax=Lysobacter korlensis TaxID=553636 RepID=A0ABV6RMT9_9GAMM
MRARVRLVRLIAAAAVLGGVLLALTGFGPYAARFSSVDHLAGGPRHDYYLEVSRATVAERWLMIGGGTLVLAGVVTAAVVFIRERLVGTQR